MTDPHRHMLRPQNVSMMQELSARAGDLTMARSVQGGLEVVECWNREIRLLERGEAGISGQIEAIRPGHLQIENHDPAGPLECGV